MIRFVDVSEALAIDDDDLKSRFSFFDTVTNSYLILGGQQVFESEVELRNRYDDNPTLFKPDVEKLVKLIPADYFKRFIESR